jgi:hypothetical protein
MKKVVLLVCCFFVFLSCTKSMRYSYEEIREFPPEIQEHIKKGEVVTGMTFQQVRLAWGPPTVTKALPPTPDGRERVQWEYRRWAGAFKTILRFTDGKLTEIISTEPGIAK